jgi:hypothetical protein
MIIDDFLIGACHCSAIFELVNDCSFDDLIEVISYIDHLIPRNPHYDLFRGLLLHRLIEFILSGFLCFNVITECFVCVIKAHLLGKNRKRCGITAFCERFDGFPFVSIKLSIASIIFL